MKLDKDTFVKHQFWFLLGGYLLVWGVAVFWLKASAGEPIENAKKAFDTDKSGLQTAQRDPVNVKEFLPPWEKQYVTFNGHKTTIWTQAWDVQSPMYDWPPEWMNGKDMTTPQTVLTDKDLADFWHKYYPKEVENLKQNAPKWLYPIEWKGGFNAIFEPYTIEKTPTREECWLIQEDYWVKRELFAVLWRAMGDLALMLPGKIDDEEKTRPEGVVARYRFHNENWEITLNLRKDKGVLVLGGDSTIKNVHPTRRTQSLTSAKGNGIVFNVAQDKIQTQFMVQGEPLAWAESRAFNVDKDMNRKDIPLSGIKWDEDYLKEHPVLVSQAFDATTSPIRRLNAIKLCQQDYRTYVWPLQSYQELEQLDAQPEDPDAKKPDANAAPSTTGMPGAPAMPSGGMQPPGGMGGMAPNMMAAGGASTTVGNPTPNNNIERNRYLRPANQEKTINPPSRHLPFALQLIVEQSHVNDVLLALGNSRLRVQITQVEFRHAKDYTPGSDSDSTGSGRFFMGPGMPGMYSGMGKMPGMPGMGGSGMMPPMPKGGTGMPPGAPGSMNRMMEEMSARGRMPGGMSGPMLGTPPPMMQRPPTGGMGSPMPGMMPPGIRPPGTNPPGDKPKKSSAATQADDNLVELTIYGISTLYRRPEQPKTTEQSAAPGAPTTPGVAPPPSGPKPPAPPVGDKR